MQQASGPSMVGACITCTCQLCRRVEHAFPFAPLPLHAYSRGSHSFCSQPQRWGGSDRPIPSPYPTHLRAPRVLLPPRVLRSMHCRSTTQRSPPYTGPNPQCSTGLPPAACPCDAMHRATPCHALTGKCRGGFFSCSLSGSTWLAYTCVSPITWMKSPRLSPHTWTKHARERVCVCGRGGEVA